MSSSTTRPVTRSQTTKDPMTQLQEKLSEMHRIVSKTDELNQDRSELKPEIINLIKQNGLEETQFSIGNLLIRYKADNTRYLNNTYLYQALKAYYKENLQAADQLYQYIIENRPQRESETLEILRQKD